MSDGIRNVLTFVTIESKIVEYSWQHSCQSSVSRGFKTWSHSKL